MVLLSRRLSNKIYKLSGISYTRYVEKFIQKTLLISHLFHGVAGRRQHFEVVNLDICEYTNARLASPRCRNLSIDLMSK